MWQVRGGSSSVIGGHDTSSMPKRFPVPVNRKLRTTASGNEHAKVRGIVIAAFACANKTIDEITFKDVEDISFRYEYDDHYFLTDPREFIYEFFPLQEEWQLLKQPISLKDFEELPFVRSLFFR